MIFQKSINVVGPLISWLYGLTILLIFDLIYTCEYSFPNDPMFQDQSNQGIVRGILSMVAYFSLMFILHYKAKSKVMERPKNMTNEHEMKLTRR